MAKRGLKIGIYRFGNAGDIKAGRIDGRMAFSKVFSSGWCTTTALGRRSRKISSRRATSRLTTGCPVRW